ncbi:MAG: aminodeoxychorismate/anthranilate synthase component II [Lentisphaerae bacterium]|jgi:anthranilate synthase/aminodeoxychorismate synthase-like glutamine amidotransferase|nr:aminodeoxychorismate/anthranilate synthase component II [Lentisphaerota bacterium]
MILLIDNYDSFTYNIVQYLLEMDAKLHVVRNDAITTAAAVALNPSALIISPGPGRPENAGISCELIAELSGKIPILGICLGHQAIGHVFGARIIHAARLMHGKVSEITADGQGVYEGLGNRPFKAMRYHSLALERATLPRVLKITAESDDGEIMGIRHTTHHTEGIQFHPESIMTAVGKRILRNFLKKF